MPTGPAGSNQTLLLTPTIRLFLEEINPFGDDSWDEYDFELKLMGADTKTNIVWDDSYLVSDGFRSMVTGDTIKGTLGGIPDAIPGDEPTTDPDDLRDDADGAATQSGHVLDFVGARYNIDTDDPDDTADPPLAFRGATTEWQILGYIWVNGSRTPQIASPSFVLDAADHPVDGVIHYHTIAPASVVGSTNYARLEAVEASQEALVDRVVVLEAANDSEARNVEVAKAEADAYRMLDQQFPAVAGGRVGVNRVGDDYGLFMPIDRWKMWKVDLEDYQSNGLNLLQAAWVVAMVESVNQEDGTVTFTDGSSNWSSGSASSNASAYDGDYRLTDAAGHVEWDTPADAETIVVRHLIVNNGGIGRVLIDGDATAATSLQTAQDLVDDSTLPSTVLVANGGALNPTDRVINCHKTGVTTWDNIALLAYDLEPAVRTVRVEWTGAAPAASSSDRLYISGFGSNSVADDAEPVDIEQTHASNSAWEMALEFATTGESEVFLGSVHGHETQTALSIEVDGSSVSPVDGGSTVWGEAAKILRTSELEHPDTAGVAADFDASFKLDRSGLTVKSTLTFNVDGDIHTWYPLMSPLANDFDEARFLGDYDVINTDNDDDVFIGTRVKALGAAAWSDRHVVCAAMTEGDAVSGWYTDGTDSSRLTTIQDRSTLNKVYVRRGDGGVEPVESGDILSSTSRHRVRTTNAGALFTDIY